MLSTTPSQSLSMLSHTSVVGEPAVTEQVVLVPEELHTHAPVRAQAPTPTVQLVPREPPGPRITAAESRT
jgi:hypothetical protein